MKKVILSVVMVMLFASMAFASARQNVGCGLGSIIWDSSKSDNSAVSQALMATTNGTFGNQTFGISSGTSECKQPAHFVSNEAVTYAAANLDGIAKDVAAGKGESLDTLAELLNIPVEKRAEVYARLQANFSAIFGSEQVEVSHVLDSIVTLS